jgi:hypothetical protein
MSARVYPYHLRSMFPVRLRSPLIVLFQAANAVLFGELKTNLGFRSGDGRTRFGSTAHSHGEQRPLLRGHCCFDLA